MCLDFSAKGAISTEDAVPPIQILRRYDSARGEAVFALARPRKGHKAKIAFWRCPCGSRVHKEIMVCEDCGNHQKQDILLSDKVEKMEKACENMKKELERVKKEKRESDEDSRCSRDKLGQKDDKKCENCKCKRERDGKKEEKSCHCPKTPSSVPSSNHSPVLVLVPALVPSPGHSPVSIPAPAPIPPPVQHSPIQAAPVVNVIVPECRDIRHKGSPLKKISPSISSIATDSSFERVRHRVSGLGRRVFGLETREFLRDEQNNWRRGAEDALRHGAENRRKMHEVEEVEARLREDIARERAKNKELAKRQAINRARAEERAIWREREFVIPIGSPDPRFDHHHHHPPQFGRGWDAMGRWER